MQRKYTSFFAALMFILVGIVLQFYIDKNLYFDISGAKSTCVKAISVVAVIGLGVWAYETARNRRSLQQSGQIQKLSFLDWSILAFGASSILSFILVKQHKEVFMGSKSMDVGTWVYLTGIAVYFLVSRHLKPKKWLFGILVAAFSAIFIWTLANQCGHDSLGWHSRLIPGEVYSYVSTLGNVNAACLAIGTFLPIAFILFLFAEKKWLKRLLGVSIFLGCASGFATGSDGILLSYAFLAPFALYIASRSRQRTIRLFEALLMAALGVSFYHLLHSSGTIPTEALFDGIIDKWVGEIAFVLAAVLCIVFKSEKLKIADKALETVGTVLSLCSVCFIFGIIAYFAVNTKDPSFGNGRGALWTSAIRVYDGGTLPMKLFGFGNGLFAPRVNAVYQELTQHGITRSFTTCHNIYIQALLAQGIFGLLALLAGTAAMILTWFRKVSKIARIENPSYEGIASLVGFTATACCFGISLIETIYPNTVLLFFLVIAISQCGIRNYKSIG